MSEDKPSFTGKPTREWDLQTAIEARDYYLKKYGNVPKINPDQPS